MNDRAIVCGIQRIPTSGGTAVNVQAMVYGNTGDGPDQTWRSRNRRTAPRSSTASSDQRGGGRRRRRHASRRRAEEADAERSPTGPHPPDARETLQGIQDFSSIEDGVVTTLPDAQRQADRHGGGVSINVQKEKLIDWKTAIIRNWLTSSAAPFSVFDTAVAGARAIATSAGRPDGLGQIYLNAERAVAARQNEKVLVRIETSRRSARRDRLKAS
jgi:hypothetical protein